VPPAGPSAHQLPPPVCGVRRILPAVRRLTGAVPLWWLERRGQAGAVNLGNKTYRHTGCKALIRVHFMMGSVDGAGILLTKVLVHLAGQVTLFLMILLHGRRRDAACHHGPRHTFAPSPRRRVTMSRGGGCGALFNRTSDGNQFRDDAESSHPARCHTLI
jgi:hypothetical protein